MRANSWLYQFYSLHSKMHFGLAYDAHAAAAARLPAYYQSSPTGPPAIAYPATPAPETPYHPAYHMHAHAAMNPLSAPGGHAHHGPNSAVLQYSPQAGSLPYPSLVPMNASPVAVESESHRQTSLKRIPSPTDHGAGDETESPEPSPKRANHHSTEHYLPPAPPSSYHPHHPRAASLGYAASMFGGQAFYYSNLISYS